MNNLINIKRKVDTHLSRLESDIKDTQEKLIGSYLYNFGWGYAGHLYKQMYEQSEIRQFANCDDEKKERWLKHTIREIEKKLLERDIYSHSTSQYANLAFQHEREVDQELRIFFNNLLEELQDDEPIKAKQPC